MVRPYPQQAQVGAAAIVSLILKTAHLSGLVLVENGSKCY